MVAAAQLTGIPGINFPQAPNSPDDLKLENR